MIYDYVNTKPPIDELYDDMLEHGWLKDQAAKVHKYIDRWKGKNGKWVYRYYRAKSKAQGALARGKRIKKLAFNASDEIGRDGTVVRRPGLKKYSKSAYERRTATRVSGKHKGKYISSASGNDTKKKIETTKIDPHVATRRARKKDIEKGRASASIKKYTKKKRQSLNNQKW